MKRIFQILILALFLSFGANTVISAAETKTSSLKDTAPKTEEVTPQNDDEFREINAELRQIEEDIKSDNFTRQYLDEALSFVNETDLALEATIRRLEKEQNYAQEALATFGEEAAEGNEDGTISEMRERYTNAVSSYKNKLIEAYLLKTEISRITTLAAEARNRILIGNLVAKKNALIVPRTFWHAISDAVVFFWNITKSPIEWHQNLNSEEKTSLYQKGWVVILLLGLILSLGIFVRKYIIQHWGYARKTSSDQPGYGQKVIVAIVTAIAYGAIPSLLIGGCLLWVFNYNSLIDSNFGKILASALFYALHVTLTCAATRVVLAPWNGRWRLFNISDARAEKVFRAMTLSIVLLGAASFLLHIAKFLEPTETLLLLLSVVLDAIRAFTIILVTISVCGDIKSPKTDTEETEIATDDEESMSTQTRVIIFATLFALATFCISIFGYPDLASFIFNRFFVSIILCGMFVVIRKVIFDILRRSIIFWSTTFRLRKRLLSKVDLLMSLLITPILVLFLTFSLLKLWGVPSSFMLYGAKKFIFGFKVGGIHISLIAILTGLLVFIISITLVRAFNRRLNNNLLTRINMDEGIKHSLSSGISFIGVIISVILAIAAMGVDLSNLAVIAGALSVGIGFGLQDIIKNLVSGIIILFERPFKVGDWVILGGEEGKIKQINIRSTELETFTKRSVIIPNATLISSSLINLTHGDNWQRQTIIVGVSYDSDIDKVTQVLLECARSNKRVSKVPSPIVLFKDFGASSLDFELRYYVPDVRTDYVISSELRYTIFKRFAEENIEIAYPQIVVHKGK